MIDDVGPHHVYLYTWLDARPKKLGHQNFFPFFFMLYVSMGQLYSINVK